MRRALRSLVLLVAVLLACALAPAASARADELTPAAAFDAGVAAYRDGDIEGARALWLRCLESAVPAQELPADERARVLRNLGNAAFRLERPLEAAAWYERALALAPRDGALLADLELARREADLEPMFRGDLSSTGRRVLGFVTPAESLRVGLCATALCALVLLLEALRGGRAWGAAAAVALACTVLAWSPYAWHATRREGPRAHVIAPGGAPLRAEPSAARELVGRLDAGKSAWWLDELPGWVRVEAEDGLVGWVPADAVLAPDI